MEKTQHYDAMVIGGGQAGVPLAVALAKSGRKSVIIERKHLGGTCINEGCTPTKTMVASARVAYLARRGSDYGVNTETVSVDLEKVRQRKRDIVDSFRAGRERRVNEAEGLEYLMGEASFVDNKLVEVKLNSGETVRASADLIFINTGARPSSIPLEGIDTVPTLNSTSIMELGTIPEHLIVLGGGYIGLEFGQMFHRFGSEVTVVQRSKRLLGREDADVADAVAEILRQDGINLLLETPMVRVKQNDEGKIELTVNSAGEERTVVGSHLLVAAGRTPNTDALNLAATGLSTDKRGFIPVNEKLETSVPGIYALGDVNGGPAFTHISYDDFRIIRTNVIEGGNTSTTGRMLPYVMFIDPQLGRIGMSEDEAREKGLNIRVAKQPMNYVARALEVDESRGFMKAVVDAETDQILGAAVLGLEGGELMAMLQIAMLGKVPASVLRETVFAHPTLAESLNNLFSSYQD